MKAFVAKVIKILRQKFEKFSKKSEKGTFFYFVSLNSPYFFNLYEKVRGWAILDFGRTTRILQQILEVLKCEEVTEKSLKFLVLPSTLKNGHDPIILEKL